MGPAISFRGIDNRSYYLLDSDPLVYINKTGVGNTVNVWDPALLQLIMDALRYWATDMHVDGFRFDECAVRLRPMALTRSRRSSTSSAKIPCVSQMKLIAEPWLGDTEPQMLGNFPPLWSQWNGDFHWALRDFWKTTEGSLRAITNGLLRLARDVPGSIR